MLSLFKEKLDELASSLKGSETTKSSRHDYNAGARLLAKYERHWEDIHSLSEANSKQARVVDKQIEECFDTIRFQRFAIKKFNGELSDLSNVIVLTEQAVNGIGNIRTFIEEIQDKIIELEDLIEAEEHVNRMAAASERLAEFRKEQLISLDALRERLAEDYDERLKECELRTEEVKKKNFEEAEKKFREELNAYKETGNLPRKDPVQPSLSIDEVEIEQDLESLQEYLKG